MSAAKRSGVATASRLAGRKFLGRAVLGFLLVLSLLSGAWTLLWLLLQKKGASLGLTAASWSGGLLVFLATLLVFGLVVNLIGLFMRRRHPEPFSDLSEALRRIAGGDFSVKVDASSLHRLGRVADEVNLMTESLGRMEELRQEFISTVSHEIQSPLTSIAGFALALRESGLSEETRLHYLSIIEEESARLSRLADGLLNLSALEERGREACRSLVALDAQLRSVVLASEPQWSAKGLELELELEPVSAMVDEGMTGRVWTNLFHNAIKFSAASGPISISLRSEGGRAIVRFADRGLGISPEDLPRVFDRFFKADRSRSRSDPGSGSGLGLTIAKKTVELHGGRILAESPGLGFGSVFTVELPLEAS